MKPKTRVIFKPCLVFLLNNFEEQLVLYLLAFDYMQVVIGPRKLKTIQSGSKFANQWSIQWKQEDPRFSNPLMGWTASSDPMGGIKV